MDKKLFIVDIDTPGQKKQIGTLAVDAKKTGQSMWHRGEGTEFYSVDTDDYHDLDFIADNFIFNYSVPKEPPFDDNARLITLGSCFADRLRRWLSHNKKLAENILVPSGLNNTFALRQFISWAVSGQRCDDAYAYDKSSDGICKWELNTENKLYSEAFSRCSGIVVTLGLAEVWRDRTTGGVFWRGVPEAEFDLEKHECVLTSVDENAANLRKIVKVVREYLGDIPIVLTLSPVPLKATMRGISPVVADCLSKSVLRCAIDEALRDRPENVYYWPSFEFIRWIGAHTPYSTYGADTSARHPANRAVEIIINRFVSAFFK